MSEISVRATLHDGNWLYEVAHPYDLSAFEETDTGPFDRIAEARDAALTINELVVGNPD